MAKKTWEEIKKIGNNTIVSTIFFWLAIVFGLANMFYSFLWAFLLLLAGIFICPPFKEMLKNKFKIDLSQWSIFIVCFILVVLMGIFVSKGIASLECTPFWRCSGWSACGGDRTQTRTCVDENNCQTYSDKPVESPAKSQSCSPLLPTPLSCTPKWQCYSWSECSSDGIQTRICFDTNNCQPSSGKPRVSQSCTPPITAFQIGQTVLVGSLAYRVNSVSTASEVGKYYFDTFYGEKADGIFYVVDITIENKGKESENMYATTLKIVDDQEREFDYDTGAEIYYQDEDKKAISFGEQLQPGLPITGVRIFDLPKDAKGLRLKILGSGLSPDEAFVDLGK